MFARLTSLARSLVTRLVDQALDRLSGQPPCSCHPIAQPEPTSPPEPATTEVVESQAATVVEVNVKETEEAPIIETPTPESTPILDPESTPATLEQPTRQCRNRKHPQTGEQCTNQVYLDVPDGACDDCVQRCMHCDTDNPRWYQYCRQCKATAKRCQNTNCGAELPFRGPDCCQNCTHKCARNGCKNLVPKSEQYCTEEICQQAKHEAEREQWVKDNWGTQKSGKARPGTGWLQPETPTPRHKCKREGCNRMIPVHYPYCVPHKPAG